MSFFRFCIYICLCMIALSLVINFVNGLNAFPTKMSGGMSVKDTSNALEQLTGLTGGMESIWLLFTSLGAIGAVALAIAIGSFIPIAIYIYGTVFWTSFIRASSVLSFGGYIPSDLILIFSVIIMFVFIASCIGMTTADVG